jgi:hypothetical protein
MKGYPRNVSHRHGRDSGDLAVVENRSTGFSFLSVEPTRVSVHLTWTSLEEGARYMVFSQEVYGVYFTKRKTFKFVGLEPGKTYHVFVLAVEQGPQSIAFTEFETLA